jgi:hypothetical protein
MQAFHKAHLRGVPPRTSCAQHHKRSKIDAQRVIIEKFVDISKNFAVHLNLAQKSQFRLKTSGFTGTDPLDLTIFAG